jgi:hypothetical protein
MSNHFQGTKENPYHISIGALVMNKEGLVACHYFENFHHKSMGLLKDFVLLMRETIEENESIEECLHRGLTEEFGMKAELKSYIGSIVSHFPIRDTGVYVEKTTLYFLCDFISQDDALRSQEDIERESVIKWFDPEGLVIKMKEQSKRLGREDMEESSVIERMIQKQEGMM